jgi:hypothetical protein
MSLLPCLCFLLLLFSFTLFPAHSGPIQIYQWDSASCATGADNYWPGLSLGCNSVATAAGPAYINITECNIDGAVSAAFSPNSCNDSSTAVIAQGKEFSCSTANPLFSVVIECTTVGDDSGSGSVLSDQPRFSYEEFQGPDCTGKSQIVSDLTEGCNQQPGFYIYIARCDKDGNVTAGVSGGQCSSLQGGAPDQLGYGTDGSCITQGSLGTLFCFKLHCNAAPASAISSATLLFSLITLSFLRKL